MQFRDNQLVLLRSRDRLKFMWAKGDWLLAMGLLLSLVPYAGAADFTIGNPQLSVTVSEQDGSYEIRTSNSDTPVLHSFVAAQINQHWVKSNDYPSHQIKRSDFDDVLGHGQQLTVTCRGSAGRANLIYVIRIYEQFPFGDIEVQVQNHTSGPITVQSLRSVDVKGDRVVDLGGSENSERVLSDTWSESNFHVRDLSPVPQGMHFAIGSQLIYNRESKQGLFFGALTADRLATILRLQVEDIGDKATARSYTIDSSGVTEIKMTSKWFRESSPENRVQLSLPVSRGTFISSERLMFAVGSDYHALLEHYGAAIRKLHHARVDSPSLMGWWTSPMEYNFTVNEGQAATNAQWLSEHLKQLGYDFFQIDSPYLYSFGEYTHPNARMYPHGMRNLAAEVSQLGLKFGIWVSPFEVGERSWVFKQHQDWLLRNSRGQPIVGPEVELKERFGILDTTHPGAQAYLRQTYKALTREWGLRYIKLDFMDMTAVEGNYHRPHTTALEALRIGLQVIRDAVGDDVLLDKDGSPMLTPVGIVDEGRVSGDAGHSFAVWKDRSPGILARYYMHRNFFVNDPDAFTLLKEVPKLPMLDPDYNNIAWGPLTLDEAQMSIVLAANTGGMFSIGDDLPSLSTDSERVRLLSNKDLLQMVKLGKASRPIDLLDYSPEDLQPSVTFLREDDRQSMLTVFNWTEQPRSHEFSLADLGLPENDTYKMYDVLRDEQLIPFGGKKLALRDQKPHSVRLVKIVDESQAPMPPNVKIEGPESGKIDETLAFSVRSGTAGVLPLDCHWDFGDGVTGEGGSVRHAYTLAGTYTASVTVEGVDGVPARKTFSIKVAGYQTPGPPIRYVEQTDAVN